MATSTTMRIEDYTAATNIDPVNDLLLEYQNSSGVYKSTNRNTFLALASAPLGLTDNQTVSNKTIGITNTLTTLDSTFTIQDNGDNTKQVQFQLSGLTTGNTRTITMPDASGTLGLLGSAQTWSGVNSFTGSSWSGGTISNASIAADTITGFTSSTSGNIYGIAITSGVITGAATVGSTALITNAVQGNQLATNAIKLGYAQITTTFTTSATSATQVTGLTLTVTIPVGGRSVKITAAGKDVFTNTGAAAVTLSIWDGTVGSGTQLAGAAATLTAASTAGFVEAVAVVTPAAGSKTYNIGLQTNNGSNAANLEAASTSPAFILVETI